MSVKENDGGTIKQLVCIAAYIFSLVLHVWTIVIAFLASGLSAAVLTLIFPVLSQIYWFLKVGSDAGFGTAYCVAVIAYVGFLGIVFLGAMIANRGD